MHKVILLFYLGGIFVSFFFCSQYLLVCCLKCAITIHWAHTLKITSTAQNMSVSHLKKRKLTTSPWSNLTKSEPQYESSFSRPVLPVCSLGLLAYLYSVSCVSRVCSYCLCLSSRWLCSIFIEHHRTPHIRKE